jgi:hypothetical protein
MKEACNMAAKSFQNAILVTAGRATVGRFDGRLQVSAAASIVD